LNKEFSLYKYIQRKYKMAHHSLLALLISRQAFSLLLIFTFLTVLPIHEQTVIDNSERTSSEPTTEEVTFINKEDVLAGTLYSPKEGDPCPAVVLLTGSNRGPRGPLLRRIAVLHYDSAGTGRSTGNASLQSRDDRAHEAISAIRFLRTQQSIDPNHVGLWGASEGASIAFLTAATYGQEVSFVIPVSGGVQTGGSIFEQTYHSTEKFAYANNLTLDEMLKIVTLEQLSYAFFGGLDILDWNLIETRTKRWIDEPWAEYITIARMRTGPHVLNAEEKQQALDSLRYVMRTFMEANWSKLEPWQESNINQVLNLNAEQFFAFLEMRPVDQDWDWDLRRKAEKVTCPVLSIFGEDDDAVPANLVATRLRQYLSNANNQDFEVKIIPGAGHYLTRSGSGWTGEFVTGYLDTMTSWIHAHSTNKSRLYRR
jgi:pimeloyl-ACP methyl ester carboxylesterase